MLVMNIYFDLIWRQLTTQMKENTMISQTKDQIRTKTN